MALFSKLASDRESLCLCTNVDVEEVDNISKWRKSVTWLILVIAIAVFDYCILTGSAIGKVYVLVSIELSIPQIGIICDGITSVSVFVRCVK